MSDEVEHAPESAMGDPRERRAGPRYYDADKNPDGAQFFGVPLRDLSAEEFESLPAWLQFSVDAAPFYRRSKPRSSAPAPSDPAS